MGKYIELLEQSYKKLKSSVYFDKTQLILRDKIVRFETTNSIDEIISDMAEKITNCEWDALLKPIYNSISYVSFPKKLQSSTSTNGEEKAILISNVNSGNIFVDEKQYFIDMDIRGYILGIAWILVVGYLIDEEIYEHSYGNRLRKNLIDEETGKPTYSPYLFEPYFQQYESWRDTALNYAKKTLDKNQDVVLLTLDFKRFYYNVNITTNELLVAVDEIVAEKDLSFKKMVKPLTEFVGKVIEIYSGKLSEELSDIKKRLVLPIGFHPSNILANYCLKKFDDTLVEGWNPIYYGRYVDDIIIVDKVEKNSKIYKEALNGKLTADQIINYYLLSSDAWRRDTKIYDGFNRGILTNRQINKNEELNYIEESKSNGKFKENEVVYSIHKDFVQFSGSDIIVQNKKVKIFYFNSKQSDALLDCFQNKLCENKSEFRFLPEDEPVFQDGDYSEIYSLLEKEGPNRLRGVEDVSIDKFNLSKFLGKYMRISGLVIDKKEKRFEKDIDKIFNDNTIIENYLAWEKVISILANGEKYDAIKRFVNKIIGAIYKIKEKDDCSVADSLIRVLRSALNKSLSTIWGNKVKELILKITEEKLLKTNYSQITEMRKGYCETRMCDKYSIQMLIDGYISKGKTVLNDSLEINITKITKLAFSVYDFDTLYSNENEYLFYPYLITMNELTIYNSIRNMYLKEPVSSKKDIDEIKDLYTWVNYHVLVNKRNIDIPVKSTEIKCGLNCVGIQVGMERKSSIKIAVANAILFETDFENVLKDSPNRSYERYHTIMKVVNDAISNNVDILVMPESFLPFEWIPIISRTCAKNQMALVSGIEHFKMNNKNGEDTVHNLTAIILPFVEDSYRFSYVHFHEKNHLSPDENDTITSYRCLPSEGDTYELFSWNDFWFSVYCCYELASIRERSIFQSYVDAIVAVEWNRDTKYYSNIVESLSRDLHCYCIQVNTAKYGDSRITQPSKSEEKDLLNVKGGVNPTILVDSIKIKELREFQFKGNLLQSKSKQGKFFKPTPPDFNYDVVKKKIEGKLWEYLESQEQ